MSTDNRTMLNDCEANTGWTGDDASTVVNATGEFYEGSAGLSSQFGENVEEMYTTQDSVGMGTFNIDLSDSTVYMLVKDNLGEPFSQGGMGIVLGDGTDRIGYYVGGNDAIGIPLATFFNGYKLDVSVIVATPGTDWTAQAGSEANLAQTAITQIGIQTHHLAKANGPSDNCFYDAFRYIANDSYALTINGGSVTVPETMADVVADDITNGWGMVSNPVGSQFYFFAPTEFGEDAAAADHYFRAVNEQWYWLGDNGGGHAVGATHFPMRVIGNATDFGEFILTGVVIVNTGTGSEFDASSVNVDVLEIDGCTMIGLASFDAPSLATATGDSRFCTDTIFSQCGQVTHNGADMSGCSFLEPIVAANGAALFYDETTDPNSVAQNMVFEQGAAAHHAFTFGANIPASITITGADFTGFASADNDDGSIFRFEDTTGTITLNLVNCTHDGSGFSVDSRAGATVNVVINPVALTVKAITQDQANIAGASVLVRPLDNTDVLPFKESVTIQLNTAGDALVSHTAHAIADGKLVEIVGADQEEYNGIHTITLEDANSYTYPVTGSPTSPATGTITATAIIIEGETNASGEISDTRSYTGNQAIDGDLRKGSASPVYVPAPISGTINASSGLTATVTMTPDE